MGTTWVLLAALAAVMLADPDVDYRLPRSLWPHHYSLEVVPFIGYNDCNFTFQGQVWIEVECVESTDSITLHAKELNISKSDVTVKNKETQDIISISWQNTDPSRDFYLVGLDKPLEVNNTYVLYFSFAGVLSEGLAGLYRSSYEDLATGKTRWLAVTQFESTDARRAFPCFDEPEFKAHFKLSLGRVANYSTVSNMPLLTSEPMRNMRGWMMDYYETSERMSTYLVAYLVSDMEFHISQNTPNHVMFRVWARKDAINQTDFAAEVGPKILQYFEKYFNLKYPLPKQDMVAIPDFNAGAMENWGLITYREALLLYDPDVSSVAAKQSVASVISHELAHQWFGNLVTMKWWSDLWLNEGFATYVAALGVHHSKPVWNSLLSEAVESLLIVFTFDSLVSSHPVSVSVHNPNDIGQIFDTISYKKGGLLLRMMNLFLGEDVFRSGVSNYLQEHRFSNAEQDDLWYELTKEAHRCNVLDRNKTVKQIMDTWTLQTGYPIITVKRNYKDGSVAIRQQRYLSYQKNDPRRRASRRVEPCWIVPISYTTESLANFEDTRPSQWLTCNERNVTLNQMANKDEWLILNVQAAGLYRINYDEDNWQLIRETLDSANYTKIGVMNRVQLIDDVMDLAWTGDVDYDIALQVMDYLHREMDYLPWRAAFSNMNILNRVLRRTAGYGLFRRYMRKLLATSYERLGDITQKAVPDDLMGTKHHALVVAWACRLHIGDCLNQARDLYKRWMDCDNPDVQNPIPRDLRTLVYCTAIKYGGEQEWNFAWERYLKSNVGTEKTSLLSNLGCTRELWLLQRFLEWTLDDDNGIRRQDSYNVFASIIRNDVGYSVAKEFFMTRIAELHAFYGPKAGKLSRYLTVMAEQMYSEDELIEFQEFLSKNSVYMKESQLSVKQALEAVKVNIQWHKKNYERFIKLLESYED